MKVRVSVCYVVLFLVAIVVILFCRTVAIGRAPRDGSRAGMPASRKMRLLDTYGKLPLSFEVNQGQTEADVKFLARATGFNVLLTSNELVLAVHPSRDRKRAADGHEANGEAGLEAMRGSRNIADGRRLRSLAHGRGSDGLSASSAKSDDETSVALAQLSMKFVGAKTSPKISGLDELPGKSNYLIGNDRSNWRTNISNFARVKYNQIYPGIDLVYYGNQRQLEYDLIVAAGANPKAIRLQIDGANDMTLDADGGLALASLGGERMQLLRPRIYQEIGGQRREIPGGFILNGKHEVAFEIGSYDSSKPLVIDPVLLYSTFLGGSGSTQANAIALDNSGNAYVTGFTSSIDFPSPISTQGPGSGMDAFVSKLSADGSSLLYSTFIGGSADDHAWAITIDAAGEAYITGDTMSGNFPIVNPTQPTYAGGSDAFIAELNSSGSALLFSAYLGSADYEIGSAIAVDKNGMVYIAGSTSSLDFPTANPLQRASGFGASDGFIAKLNPAMRAPVYATYLGGKGDDYAYGLALDAAGNVYVTGTTTGDFPVTAGAFQEHLSKIIPNPTSGFVAKINAAGSALVYSTYMAGSRNDFCKGIVVDSAGSAYIGGYTSSSAFYSPQTEYAGGYDAFAAKLKPDGSGLIFFTYIGGAGDDLAMAIAIDLTGSVYLTGQTNSKDFPVNNAWQSFLGGTTNAFVTKLSAAGSLLVYSSYLGGGGADKGLGIAADASGNAYVTGITSSADFPTLGAPMPVNNGSGDAFISKIGEPNPVPVLSSLSPATAITGGAAFSLTVTGSNLLPVSVVRWNGNNRPTTFVSRTQLTASISAADIAAAGMAQITVVNPSPGGGSSSALTLTINGAVIGSGGVVNGASFAAGIPIAPGSIASVFGNSFDTSTSGNPTLRMNGAAAFIFDVTASQMNFQIPWELAGQSQASLTVTVNGVASTPATVNLADFSPGIFTLNPAGQGAVVIASSGELAAPVGSISGRSARPARRGEYITIYCTGLGPVTNQPASGVRAVASPLSVTKSATTVTFAGSPAPALTDGFSGLAPGFVGLYQVNVQVPQSTPPGDAVPVAIFIGGSASNIVTIAVQ